MEGQVRSLGFYERWHYYELKGAINYNFNPHYAFAAGFGTYNTYTEGGNFQRPIVREELRNWQQLVMNQPEGWLRVEHRYRAEQRFTNVGFRNRFRYRLQLVKPIRISGEAKAPFFVFFWNEIFLTDRATYFERNRLFVGAGWRVNPGFTLQSGWLRQFDYNTKDEIGKNFLQVSFSLHFSAKAEETPVFNQEVD